MVTALSLLGSPLMLLPLGAAKAKLTPQFPTCTVTFSSLPSWRTQLVNGRTNLLSISVGHFPVLRLR